MVPTTAFVIMESASPWWAVVWVMVGFFVLGITVGALDWLLALIG